MGGTHICVQVNSGPGDRLGLEIEDESYCGCGAHRAYGVAQSVGGPLKKGLFLLLLDLSVFLPRLPLGFWEVFHRKIKSVFFSSFPLGLRGFSST